MNLYAYCQSNPINALDPLGLCDGNDSGFESTWVGGVGKWARGVFGANRGSGSATNLGNAANGNSATVRDLTSGSDDDPDAFVRDSMNASQRRIGAAGHGVSVGGDEMLGGLVIGAVTEGAGRAIGSVAEGTVEATTFTRQPTPVMPEGINNASDFGKLVGWGANPDGATAALNNLTDSNIARMRQGGLTPDIAMKWAAFYENHSKYLIQEGRVSNVNTPVLRAKLMQEIAKRL